MPENGRERRVAKPLKALLVPLPLMGWPFDRVTLDIAGPFPHSQAGYQFILVINRQCHSLPRGCTPTSGDGYYNSQDPHELD